LRLFVFIKLYTINRISETIDNETIFYINDINRRYEEVLQTYGADGNVINTYTYGVDRINSVGKDNEVLVQKILQLMNLEKI